MEDELNYLIYIQLKEVYHSEFEQFTGNNLGNYLAVVQDGDILHPSYSVLQTFMSNGKISLGGFDSKEKAREVMQQVLPND